MKFQELLNRVKSLSRGKVLGIIGGLVVLSLAGGLVVVGAKDSAVREESVVATKPEIILISKSISVVKGREINAGEIIKSITSKDGLKEVSFSKGMVGTTKVTFDRKGIPSQKLKFTDLGKVSVEVKATTVNDEVSTKMVIIDVVDEMVTYVKGIKDWSIELDAENIDFMNGISFDKALIKEVKCDSTKVDTKKAGEYSLVYTIVSVDSSKASVTKTVTVKVLSKAEAKEEAEKGNVVVTNGGEVKKDSKGKAPEVKGDNSVVADGSRGESGKPITGGTGGSVASKPESKPDSSKPESKPDTSKPDTSKPVTPKPDTSKPETTKPDQHVHSWSPVTAYRKVLVSDAWSEPIYEMQDVWGTEPVYEYRVICSICGNDISSNQVDHMIGHIAEGKTQGEGILESTQVGTRPVVIGTSKVQVGQTDHPAVYADESYVSHYACSCGATK